jgi:hypothetical protein
MKQQTDLNLTIPAPIMAVPNLNLTERVILTHVNMWPDCTNNDLATLTGLSTRGIESVLARLREQGLVVINGKGRTRRLTLTFNVECHSDCGEHHDEPHHTECGEVADEECHSDQVQVTDPQIMRLKTMALTLCGNVLVGDLDHARTQLDELQAWQSTQSSVGSDMRQKWPKTLEPFDDLLFAVNESWLGFAMLPADARGQLLSSICGINPQKLTERRWQIEADKGSREQ